MEFDNFCDFFASIEKDPTAIVKDLTVRDYLNARSHLLTCEKCQESSDRTLAKAPKEENTIGFNRN